jgi:hypothetical protein
VARKASNSINVQIVDLSDEEAQSTASCSFYDNGGASSDYAQGLSIGFQFEI